MPSISTGAAGVSVYYKLPKVMLQVLLGAAVASAGGRARKLLLMGNKTSAGTLTADTQVYAPTSIEDGAVAGGTGAEVSLMFAAARTAEPNVSAYMLAVTEAAGSKATGTFTFTGTTTTGSGDARFWIHGVLVTLAVSVGLTPTQLATALASAINGKGTYLCATATSSVGVVTVTYRHNGLRGNFCALRCEMDSTVTGMTLAASAAYLSGGAGQDDLTAALATAQASVYHRITPANFDATALGLVNTHVGSMGGPLVGRYEQVVACLDAKQTLGTATTIATGINDGLSQHLFYPNAETLPMVTAAAWAATRAIAEEEPSVNLSSMNMDVVDQYPVVLPPPLQSSYLTDSQAAAALDVGLTPIQVTANGHPYIARSITTHSRDSGGNPDTRVLDTNNPTVTQAFAEELQTSIPDEFKAKVLVDDPVDSDDELPTNATTPQRLKSHCVGRAFAWGKAGRLTNVEADVATWVFSLAPNAPGRANATMPTHPAPWFVQFSAQIRQLS